MPVSEVAAWVGERVGGRAVEPGRVSGEKGGGVG